MAQPKETRYILDVEGSIGYLKEMSFAVAEAAFGYRFCNPPLYVDCGEILVNSLWISGSAKLNPKKGIHGFAACLQASGILVSMEGTIEDGLITVFNKKGKKYTCKVKEPDRDLYQRCLGLTMPLQGNPMILTAGRLVLEGCWESGDEEIKNEPELLIAASLQAFSMVEAKQGKLKKV